MSGLCFPYSFIFQFQTVFMSVNRLKDEEKRQVDNRVGSRMP